MYMQNLLPRCEGEKEKLKTKYTQETLIHPNRLKIKRIKKTNKIMIQKKIVTINFG